MNFLSFFFLHVEEVIGETDAYLVRPLSHTFHQDKESPDRWLFQILVLMAAELKDQVLDAFVLCDITVFNLVVQSLSWAVN